MQRTVNLGNYEKAELYMSVKDIHHGSTEDEIRAMVDETGGIAFAVVTEALGKQLKALRSLHLLDRQSWENEHEPN